jgi:DNA invertase Pin-like site-specific DNA recombinase
MSNITLGYARVSTYEQNLVSQEQELKKAGCTEIYTDKLSAKDIQRPQLEELLNYVRKGDILVVTKLDRLARSTKDLLSIVDRIEQKGVSLKVLNINLDTSTATGKLMLTMLGAIAEFERGIMLERQREGIAIAKAENKYKGRKPIDIDKLYEVQNLVGEGMSVTAASKQVGISRITYYKAMSEGRLAFELKRQHVDEV